MTEDEAKIKWCPYTASANNLNNYNCIASDCMMWVWDNSPNHIAQLKATSGDYSHLKPTGHCGLVDK